MAINLPGPYEVDYSYTVTVSSVPLTHHFAVSCAVLGTPAVGSTPSSVLVANKGGGSQALDAAANSLWNYYRPNLQGVSVVSPGYTLWRYVPGTLERVFITSGTLTNPTGSSANPTIAASQVKLTMRTAAGGILQINQLEGATSGSVVTPLIPAATGAWYVVLAQYLISSAGWVLARDDSYPIAGLNVAFGQNEAVFKKRYRTS